MMLAETCRLFSRVRSRHALSTFCGALLLAIFSGCSQPPAGTVTGNVTFKGEPIFLGTIAFHSHDGRTASAAISAGKYHAEKVPVGPAVVTVQAHPPTPQMTAPPFGGVTPAGESPPPAPSSTKPPPFVQIPARYAATTTSGFKLEVADGEQSQDFSLVP